MTPPCNTSCSVGDNVIGSSRSLWSALLLPGLALWCPHQAKSQVPQGVMWGQCRAAQEMVPTASASVMASSWPSPQIQTALRHKSEIEHHRNKIRLRAKRRGHYEFPVVDDLSSGDTRERHRVYRRAQMQIDKILDPTASVPSVFIEPRKRWVLWPQHRGAQPVL